MIARDVGFIVCTCLLFLSPTAGAEDRKAQSIDELANMYDVSSCKECHKEIYEQWEKSLHARSIVGTPKTAGAIGRFGQKLLPRGAMEVRRRQADERSHH